MLIDLHAHYPMHLVPENEGTAHQALLRWRDALWRARFVNFLSRLFNYEGPSEEPGNAITKMGVFDFDTAVFRELWGQGSEAEARTFEAYVKYYLSDHRPLWAQIKI